VTGEITLSGRVLPVGGIKEKVLAGHRAGLRTIILPRRNEPHTEEIPEDIRAQIEFVYADTIDDVLNYVFGVRKGPAVKRTKSRRGIRTRGTGAKRAIGAQSRRKRSA
jgi:ATP-dependent Lon protease